jgi:hypothetical protein
MKLHYYPQTDSLYIEFASAPGAETREMAEGLIVDSMPQATLSVWISITLPASSIYPRSKQLRYRGLLPRRSDAVSA